MKKPVEPNLHPVTRIFTRGRRNKFTKMVEDESENSPEAFVVAMVAMPPKK